MTDEEIEDLTELNDRELHMRYDDFLDAVYDKVKIAGLEYWTSGCLRSADPTAYRCGFCNWLNGEVTEGIIIEHADHYYEGNRK